MTPVTASGARQTAMKALDRLPALSPTVGQLLSALARSVPDVIKLERLLLKDPALSGTLLAAANSAMFSRYSATSSVMDAISRLGYTKLKRFALSQAFSKVFRFGRPPAVWSPTRFHLHSSAVGMACELLADAVPVEQSPDAFLAGLLHDLGKLLIAVAFPEQWQRIDAFALHGGNPHEKERELLQVDHAELSAMAAERWKIPAPICDAIRRHHAPVLETPLAVPLSRAVQAADQFVNSIGVCVLNSCPEGDPALPAFNGHPYDAAKFRREFQNEWESLSSLCF